MVPAIGGDGSSPASSARMISNPLFPATCSRLATPKRRSLSGRLP